MTSRAVGRAAFVAPLVSLAARPAAAVVRRILTVHRTQSDDGCEAARTPAKRWELLAHAPLVALMVGYTALSLWVVSLPVAG